MDFSAVYVRTFLCYNLVMTDSRNDNIRPYRDLTDFPAEKCIQVNNCGSKSNYGSSHTLLRPNGRKDYYLLYVVTGWLDVGTSDHLMRLYAGQCAVFTPGVPQVISFSVDGDPTIFYVHFTGAGVDEVMSGMRRRGMTIRTIGDRTMFEILFHQMVQAFLPLKALNGRKAISVPKVNGLLLQLLDLLMQSGENAIKSKQDHDAITPALLYISEHYREQIDLEQCAALTHLSPGRFAHLFTESMNVSPYKFILSLRIDEAKELLLYSSMSINEISEQIGFADSSYFSRIFRKYTGCSPSDWRKRF